MALNRRMRSVLVLAGAIVLSLFLVVFFIQVRRFAASKSSTASASDLRAGAGRPNADDPVTAIERLQEERARLEVALTALQDENDALRKAVRDTAAVTARKDGDQGDGDAGAAALALARLSTTGDASMRRALASTVPVLHRLHRAFMHQADAVGWFQAQVEAGRQPDAASALNELLRVRLDGIAANELAAVLDSEPYKSFLEHRSTQLRDVVETELYRLQYPSLSKRVAPNAGIEEVRRAATSIDVTNLDDTSRQACNSAKTLHCSLGKSCGFGCQAHHLVFCMVMAYGSNRTLVVVTDGWTYARHGGWEAHFLTLGECQRVSFPTGSQWTDHSSEQHVRIGIIDNSNYPYVPNAMPRHIWEVLHTFHSNPTVWWIGQIVGYLFRPSRQLGEFFAKRQEALGWDGPVVGIHVRRTDKIGTEAQYHPVSEYMNHVQAYFDQHYASNVQRRVYLATDDPSVISEARKSYPDVIFMADSEGASLAAAMDSRYSDESLRSVWGDIAFLSQTEYIVCTFSSQVCRLAFERMQSRYVDASFRVKSLDDPYYYGGGQREVLKAWVPYTPPQNKANVELGMRVGDMIENHARPDGFFWKGFNRRTDATAMYPMAFVEPAALDVNFPEYTRNVQVLVDA